MTTRNSGEAPTDWCLRSLARMTRTERLALARGDQTWPTPVSETLRGFTRRDVPRWWAGGREDLVELLDRFWSPPAAETESALLSDFIDTLHFIHGAEFFDRLLAAKPHERQRATRGSDSTVGARYLTVEGAARYLGVTAKALRRRVERRNIPFIRDGRRLRFDVRELDSHMASHRVRSADMV